VKQFIALILLFLIGLAPSAQAQVTHRCRVAVLNMTSPSIVSRNLGKYATDAFSAVLKKQGLEVTPDKEVEQTVKDLGFHLPLRQSEMQILGKRLYVDRVLSGEITEIIFTEPPREARVKLSLSILDVVTGEVANGGMARGQSQRINQKIDELSQVREAIYDTIYDSLILNYTTLLTTTGIIMVKDPGVVILNRGSRDGIKIGDEAIVLHGGYRASLLRIVRVDATESIGSIREGGKRRVGDQVLFLPPKPRQGQ
jgi:hypothetical protein